MAGDKKSNYEKKQFEFWVLEHRKVFWIAKQKKNKKAMFIEPAESQFTFLTKSILRIVQLWATVTTL